MNNQKIIHKIVYEQLVFIPIAYLSLYELMDQNHNFYDKKS